MIVICDIDGTIADIGHRVHYLEEKPKNWDAFYEACDKDKVYEVIRELLYRLEGVPGLEITYVSGRRESTRTKTEEWLAKHEFPRGELYMRKDKDFRVDTIVKQEILDEHFDKDEIFFVLDDRDSVVKMWRDNGLTCLQVKSGDY